MEAVRLKSGLPVYDAAHATHMYGPLVTVMLAGIFRFTGLNLLATRIVMSLFALALAIVLAIVFYPRLSRGWIAFAVLLFLGINFRTNLALLSSQPDCVAILLADCRFDRLGAIPNVHHCLHYRERFASLRDAF